MEGQEGLQVPRIGENHTNITRSEIIYRIKLFEECVEKRDFTGYRYRGWFLGNFKRFLKRGLGGEDLANDDFSRYLKGVLYDKFMWSRCVYFTEKIEDKMCFGYKTKETREEREEEERELRESREYYDTDDDTSLDLEKLLIFLTTIDKDFCRELGGWKDKTVGRVYTYCYTAYKIEREPKIVVPIVLKGEKLELLQGNLEELKKTLREPIENKGRESEKSKETIPVWLNTLVCDILNYDDMHCPRPAKLLRVIYDIFLEDFTYTGKVYHGVRDYKGIDKLEEYKDLVSCTEDYLTAVTFSRVDSYRCIIPVPTVMEYLDVKGFNLTEWLLSIQEHYRGLAIGVYTAEKEILVPIECIRGQGKKMEYRG